MAKQSGEDILKEILKNSKNPKALEQAQMGLDAAKQARKAEIASQMKGSLSSTIAQSTGPLNESTADSDNIKSILRESKEQNINLKNLIKLNEKSIEGNSELFSRLEKTMNAIVDALQEQKRQQSQTTSQSAQSKVSVPTVSPVIPPAGGGGGFNLADLLPNFLSNKNKTPETAANPKGSTSGGVKGFFTKLLKTGVGAVAGASAAGLIYALLPPKMQEKAKELLGENADTTMVAGGAVAGGLVGAKAGPKVGGALSGVLEGAQSYQQFKEIDEKLKKGEITPEEATILKTKATTGGIGGTAGGVIGSALGAFAGPLGVLAGGYLGSKVGRATGEVVPSLAGMQTKEEEKRYAEKTATEQKKIAVEKAQDNGEAYNELKAGYQKPRPTDTMLAQVWDSKYASGWNTDGSPKGKVEPTPEPQKIPELPASPIFKSQQQQMNEAMKNGDYKTAMNIAMNRTENESFTAIADKLTMNAALDRSEEGSFIDMSNGFRKQREEKTNALAESSQAQNQVPIFVKGGDTVNNVITNNTSPGRSGGGAGSPSRIPSPFDRFMIGDHWKPYPGN